MLLACLTLALQTVAQALEKAAPDDLVVTVEIMRRNEIPIQNERNSPIILLYAKLSVQNKTVHEREVTIMWCSWNDSWTTTNYYSLYGWGCDKNYPATITIPAGQALVFYGTLCRISKNGLGIPDSVAHFKLGFIDFAEGDWSSPPKHQKRKDLLKTRVVYWSNELTDDVKAIYHQEMMDKMRNHEYYVTESGK